ncbi:unnamed protein product [Urochloa humidicola]
MEGRRGNSKRKQASVSEWAEIVRRRKTNQAASASEGDEIVVTSNKKGNQAASSSEGDEIVVTSKKGNQAANASEGGGEILRRKKEMLAAMKAIGAEMYGVKLTTEAAHQAGAGKKKRTKVVKTRLPQEFIDYMIATPNPTVDEISEEELAKCSKQYREGYAKRKFKDDKIKAYYDALLDQYEAKGYAEDEAEVEVTDDEDEN